MSNKSNKSNSNKRKSAGASPAAEKMSDKAMMTALYEALPGLVALHTHVNVGLLVATCEICGEDGVRVADILFGENPEDYGVRVFWATMNDDGQLKVVVFPNKTPTPEEIARYDGTSDYPLPYAERV
jgi:hypothetical protein